MSAIGSLPDRLFLAPARLGKSVARWVESGHSLFRFADLPKALSLCLGARNGLF